MEKIILKELPKHLSNDGNLFYKIINKPSKAFDLSEVIEMFSLMEESLINELDTCVFPKYQLEYNEKLVGYATEYFEDYKVLSKRYLRINKLKAISIFIKLSKTLEKLHHAGYFHGDIHEDNIMIDDLNVKIIDWDLSLPLDKVKARWRSPVGDVSWLTRLFLECMARKKYDIDAIDLGLPKDIEYYILKHTNPEFEVINRSAPLSSYPHEWMEEFRNYTYSKKDGMFLRKKR